MLGSSRSGSMCIKLGVLANAGLDNSEGRLHREAVNPSVSDDTGWLR